MSIGIFLMAMNIYTGLFAIVTYAGNILIASGTSIDPKHAMSALAIVIILGNLTSFAIIDKAGRKVGLGLFDLCNKITRSVSNFVFVQELSKTLNHLQLPSWNSIPF